MTGKVYYITTLAAWQRHSARFANSHWLALDEAAQTGPPGRRQVEPGGTDESPRILVLIEADEGAHLSLGDDAAFEPLPHPLTQTPISGAAQSALAPHGVAPGATTFDAMEILARIHPLLRHRVF